MAYHSKYSGAEVDSLLDKIKADDVGSIDSSLSTTSENPVQNKVITQELNKKANKTDIATINGQPLTNGGNIEVATDSYDDTEIKGKLTELEEKIDTKQDTLNAGQGISIDQDTKTISCTLDTTIFKVVDSLPTAPASGDENKIHLVLSSSSEEGNTYDEYLWINNSWEKIGSFRPTVDLSKYAEKSYVDSKVGEVSTKVGNLSQLQTTEKSNLVGAINEVAQGGGGGDAVLFTPQTLSSEQKTQALLNLSLANAWECIYKDITVEASADSQQLEFELGGVQEVYILFHRVYNSNNTGNFKFNVDTLNVNAGAIAMKDSNSAALFRIEPSWLAFERNHIGFGPAIYFWNSNNPASGNIPLLYRSNEYVINVSPTKMNNLKITITNLSNQLKLQIFTRK